MNTILDRYFELSDLAGRDEKAFRDLIDCFSDDAAITPAGSRDVIQGRAAIRTFYEEFFQRSQDLRHIWTTSRSGNSLTAIWAVVGRRPDGSLFAFQGTDVAELDDKQRIRQLDIQFKT